jgi:AraC family ethanolamine operon transcriptional activator
MEVPTVPELCQAAGVSLRTLEYAFRERLGMTPVHYHKVYRLNQVRQMLKRRQTRTVVDAANAWGFWHMGKFAGDYRKVFGVTPSADLRS